MFPKLCWGFSTRRCCLLLKKGVVGRPRKYPESMILTCSVCGKGFERVGKSLASFLYRLEKEPSLMSMCSQSCAGKAAADASPWHRP